MTRDTHLNLEWSFELVKIANGKHISVRNSDCKLWSTILDVPKILKIFRSFTIQPEFRDFWQIVNNQGLALLSHILLC